MAESDGSRLVVRVPTWSAQGLVDDGIATAISAHDRGVAVDLVDVAIVTKDIATVILAIAAGANGIRAVLRWLRRSKGRDEVTITVYVDGDDHEWRRSPEELDEEFIERVAHVLDGVAARTETPKGDALPT